MRPNGFFSILSIALSILLSVFVPSTLGAVSDVAIELRNRGIALLENEMEGDAEAIYRQLLDEAPDDPLGYANLAIALLRQQKMEEASLRIEEALRLAPDRPDLLAIRGAVLVWSDEREAALEA